MNDSRSVVQEPSGAESERSERRFALSRYAWLWSWLRADTPKQYFIRDPRVRIFLVSFTMLFFELLCIRWVPSYVRYLSYFNNFLVLASCLGIGLGMLTARRERFWFPVLDPRSLRRPVVRGRHAVRLSPLCRM